MYKYDISFQNHYSYYPQHSLTQYSSTNSEQNFPTKRSEKKNTLIYFTYGVASCKFTSLFHIYYTTLYYDTFQNKLNYIQYLHSNNLMNHCNTLRSKKTTTMDIYYQYSYDTCSHILNSRNSICLSMNLTYYSQGNMRRSAQNSKFSISFIT